MGAALSAAAYQSRDSDLTTLAGLTATTDNMTVSASSACANRTPAITERLGRTVTVKATNINSGTATCNAGEVSIGEVNTGTAQMVQITPRRSGTIGWSAAMRNNAVSSNTFTPYATCLTSPIVA